MQLSFGVTPVALILAAIGAAATTYWMYRRTTPSLSGPFRFGLVTLRFVSVFLILFLLCEPILARISRNVVPPILAILVDTSESMVSSANDGGGLAEEVRRLLSPIADGVGDGQTRLFGFDTNVRDLGAIDSVRLAGQRTDISAALEQLEDRFTPSDNLGAVLLVSDGRYTAGRNPLHVAERFRVPIYTVVVGDSTEQKDIRIGRVTSNEITYAGLDLPVRVGVVGKGYEGERVSVALTSGGNRIDNKMLVIAPDGAEASVELAYPQIAAGLQQLEVSVSPLEGESTTRNNRQRLTVRVLDSKRKILLLGAAPDPDLAAVRHILSGDENNELTVRTQKAPGSFYDGDWPTLSEFDVIILAGYPGRTADRRQLQQLVATIDEGKPVIFLISRQTEIGLFGRELGSRLGVSPEVVRRGFFESTLVPAPAASRHPVMEGLADPSAWRRLPPLVHNESRWIVSPEARTLATIQVRGVSLDDPALVVRRSATRRSAAVLMAGSWRLANLPEDLETLAHYWPTLLGNLVKWTSAVEDDRPVKVSVVTEEFAGGEPVRFVGQVYDESLNPVNDADIELSVISPDGEEFRHVMSPLGNGRYTLELDSPGEGVYGYTAVASQEGAELGRDTGGFAVGNLTLEFRNPTSDPDLMRQVAIRSGGAAATPNASAMNRVSELISESASYQSRSIVHRSEAELWRQPVFLIIVIVLLTVEWTLRKRAGLN